MHLFYHHGHSCSQAVIEILAKYGLWNGLTKINLRFKHCKYAYQRILAQQKNKSKQVIAKLVHKPKSFSIIQANKDSKPKKAKKKKNSSSDCIPDAFDCDIDICDCGGEIFASGAGECIGNTAGVCECAGGIGDCSI